MNLIGELIQKNKELIFLLKDSLWYAIIMRIAKICDEDKEANNIKKIIDSCKSNTMIIKQEKIITQEELDNLYKRLEVAITDESGNAINLIKSWRDKYAAHYSKLINPLDTQKKYLITDKKMEKIINTLTNILKILCEKFNIEIDENKVRVQTENIKHQLSYLYNNKLEEIV